MSNQYYIDHAICPSCGNDEIETTCIGSIFYMQSGFRDENKAKCQCGWRGIVHELQKQKGHATLPDGITYSGLGPGGEFYSKETRGDSISLWTKGEEHWTADELRAIANHQDSINKRQAPTTRPARAESITGDAVKK
jgi:hypothetical protein